MTAVPTKEGAAKVQLGPSHVGLLWVRGWAGAGCPGDWGAEALGELSSCCPCRVASTQHRLNRYLSTG